ncbi:MAG: hypothetical protein JWN00_1457 [Actinomycetia bacterium]|nr:hypothetical protein [Actinomycetes bacterium]
MIHSITTQARAILLKAADVIEARGHHRGDYAPSDTRSDLRTCPVCVLAAINVATNHHPVTDFFNYGMDEPEAQAAAALAKHLGLAECITPHELTDVVGEEWNDAPDRTAEQVTAALRECAASL